MKCVPRMLNKRLNAFRVCSAYLNDVFEMGNDFLMRGIWFLVACAWAEIGYSLAEQTHKLVTRWLSIRGNLFLLVLNHVFPLSSVPLSPFPVPCVTSYVSCLKCLFLVSHPLFPVSHLCSLFRVHCSLPHFCVPCLPSSVSCLTSLFLVSRPLFLVSLLCSLFPALCSLSHISVPCIPSSVPCLMSLFRVSRPLFHVSLLCSLSPVLCSQSCISVPCLPFSFPNLKSLFLVSHPPFYAIYSIKLVRRMLSVRWNRFLVWVV